MAIRSAFVCVRDSRGRDKARNWFGAMQGDYTSNPRGGIHIKYLGTCQTLPLSSTKSLIIIYKLMQEEIKQALEQQRQRIVEEIKKMKPDERKVAVFGEWEARTYEDKMFARAIIDDIINLINNNK